jgi:hypothetical protein
MKHFNYYRNDLDLEEIEKTYLDIKESFDRIKSFYKIFGITWKKKLTHSDDLKIATYSDIASLLLAQDQFHNNSQTPSIDGNHNLCYPDKHWSATPQEKLHQKIADLTWSMKGYLEEHKPSVGKRVYWYAN